MTRFGWLIPIFLLACGGTVHFELNIVFPDDGSDAKSYTESLVVMAIEPADASTCQALLDGTALPDNAGYVVESRQEVDPDALDLVLTQVGPGRRLFFVQALGVSGAVILHGCADLDAGGGGAEVVTVELGYI